MISEDFLKPYDHSQEKEIYEAWEHSGYFGPTQINTDETQINTDDIRVNPCNNPRQSVFSIIMPPPNANGSLHVGHAVMVAVEDLLIRYWRMKGKKVLWLPGADHAGFETQVVFEKKLEKEGTSRFEILKEEGGREKLRQMIWDFTQENKAHMEHQIRQLGASCDWDKKTFTLDEKIVDVVYETFKKLYEDGLVYRGKKAVNWCPKHQTTLSDLEVKYEEREDSLYYVKYGPITLATVRLETKFGDTAIAVHPSDARYKDLIGKEIEVEAISGKTKIKIIADEHIDPAFGTGAVKVTPAHDADDFAIWLRHQDEIDGPKEIIDQWGRMSLGAYFSDNADVMKYDGLKVAEARKQIAADMQAKGLIEKIDEHYKHNVALCYKCGSVLEPRVLAQWFVDLTSKEGKKKIVQPTIDAVKDGMIKIIPEFQEKIFFHWMENIRDWNISRQIVWGIPIPVWFCQNQTGTNSKFQTLSLRETSCREANDKQIQNSKSENEKDFIVSKEKPEKCPFCGKCEMKQETDVFDTWFSSGQWPYATLLAQSGISNKGNKENLFEEFYPTSVMETGYDILFFWVARMIMLGLYTTGKVPFETVYLHGLVRDKDKQKMSKSKGNVVDPLGIVEQYGADALRMALIVGNSPGQDVTFSEEKVKGYRNFSNKLWNIARFVLSQSAISNFQFPISNEFSSTNLSNKDKEFLEREKEVKREVEENIENYRFSQAAEIAYHFVWHEFADKIIEEKKKLLADETISQNEKTSSAVLLNLILLESLKMLHPFMPFVTEAIYQRLPIKEKEFLIVENWEK
jgi:valyl-tRNA synthetase